MKNLTKAIALASVATLATAAQAEVSVTAGVMSDYVFRGVQTSTGSGYAAVDYETGGFYAGVWAADLDDEGLEVDLYLGYGIELDNGLTLGAGYTRYEYTDDRDGFDTTQVVEGQSIDVTIGDGSGADGFSQDEFSVNAGIAGFGLAYVLGTNNADSGDQDYDVITLTYDADNWGVLVGQVDLDDVDGTSDGEEEYNWAEISTSAEVAGLTVGATVGVQFGLEEDGVDGDSNDGYITFDISKSFDL